MGVVFTRAGVVRPRMRQCLQASVKEPGTATELAKRFARAKPADVAAILESLCVLGKARRGQVEGTYLP